MKKKSKLEKPKLQTKSYYDYSSCRDYIVEKYKVDDGDFWHYLCNYDYISNGCNLTMYRDFLDECNEDEVTESMRSFHKALIEEFCEGNEVEFEVYW